jgi:hypothetical protein
MPYAPGDIVQFTLDGERAVVTEVEGHGERQRVRLEGIGAWVNVGSIRPVSSPPHIVGERNTQCSTPD